MSLSDIQRACGDEQLAHSRLAECRVQGVQREHSVYRMQDLPCTRGSTAAADWTGRQMNRERKWTRVVAVGRRSTKTQEHGSTRAGGAQSCWTRTKAGERPLDAGRTRHPIPNARYSCTPPAYATYTGQRAQDSACGCLQKPAHAPPERTARRVGFSPAPPRPKAQGPGEARRKALPCRWLQVLPLSLRCLPSVGSLLARCWLAAGLAWSLPVLVVLVLLVLVPVLALLAICSLLSPLDLDALAAAPWY